MSNDKITMTSPTPVALATKVKDYFQLIKFTLSFMVVFSTVVCFLIAPNEQFIYRSKVASVLLLFAGGMLVSGSANAINQITEKDTDAKMKRTSKRPLASGRMGVKEATVFAFISGIAGVSFLWYFFNWQSAFTALLSLFLYGFIYTPLKKVNSIAVLVGAIPGAIPCMIGWIAAFGNQPISWAGAWIMFGIQFLWQFPHFWAIAWIAHTDYTTAGFKLLPGDKGPTKFTALQTVIYSALMIPFRFLPWYMNIAGTTSLWIVSVCNLWMVAVSIKLFVKMDVKSARTVMFSSYFYLMIVLLALFADRVAA